MKQPSVLFLNPSPCLDIRGKTYENACRLLQQNYDCEVVLVANGHPVRNDLGFPMLNIEDWIRDNRTIIDDARLVDLEKRFPKSNFWRCAVVERSITDYSYMGNALVKSNYDIGEIEWYIKAAVLFYEYVVRTYHIDFAVNHVSDNIHSHALYELSRSMGFTCVVPTWAGYWLSDNMYPVSNAAFGSELMKRRYREYRDNYETLVKPVLPEVLPHIEQIRGSSVRDIMPHAVKTRTTPMLLKRGVQALRRRWANFTVGKPLIQQSIYRSDFIRGATVILPAKLYNRIGSRRYVRELNLPEEPYVFFPLHLIPEAMLLAVNPGWMDQLAVVRLLSASIPAGYRLVVKDHPLAGGSHEPGFYDAIRRLENVVLLPEHIDSRKIVAGADLIVTIGGTVGFEATLLGKPAMVLGDSFYSVMDTLLRPPARLNDMPYVLKDILCNGAHPAPEEMERDGQAFFAAWMSIMQPAGLARALDITTGDQIPQAGRDWASGIYRLMELLADESSVNPEMPEGG